MLTVESHIAQMNPTFYYCKQPSNSYFGIARLKRNVVTYIVYLSTVEEDKDTWDHYKPQSYKRFGFPGGLSEWHFTSGLSYGNAVAELAGSTYTLLDPD